MSYAQQDSGLQGSGTETMLMMHLINYAQYIAPNRPSYALNSPSHNEDIMRHKTKISAVNEPRDVGCRLSCLKLVVILRAPAHVRRGG